MREHCFGRGGTGQVTTMPAGTAPVGREAAEVASSAGYPEIVAGLLAPAIWPVVSPVTRSTIILAG